MEGRRPDAGCMIVPILKEGTKDVPLIAPANTSEFPSISPPGWEEEKIGLLVPQDFKVTKTLPRLLQMTFRSLSQQLFHIPGSREHM